MYLTCEDIIFIHTCEDIVFDNIFCPFKSITIFWRRIKASSDLPYKSFAKFGYLWKSSQSGWKFLENHQKCCYVLWEFNIIKRKFNIWSLWDTKFLFSCWKIFHLLLMHISAFFIKNFLHNFLKFADSADILDNAITISQWSG